MTSVYLPRANNKNETVARSFPVKLPSMGPPGFVRDDPEWHRERPKDGGKSKRACCRRSVGCVVWQAPECIRVYEIITLINVGGSRFSVAYRFWIRRTPRPGYNVECHCAVHTRRTGKRYPNDIAGERGPARRWNNNNNAGTVIPVANGNGDRKGADDGRGAVKYARLSPLSLFISTIVSRAKLVWSD